MKKLLITSVIMLIFCLPFVCQVQASYGDSDSLGIVWIAKVWDKNGDCEIRCRVLGDRSYQQMKAQRDFFPGMEVKYSKDGRYYDLISDLKETGSGSNNAKVWLNGSVVIPKAYKVDFKIQISAGYGKNGSGKLEQQYVTILRYLDEGILKPDSQYPDSQSMTAFADCKFKNDAAKQQACEKSARENIISLFNEGTQHKNVWDFSKTNPPRISLKGSSSSGDWALGTFTQVFQLEFQTVSLHTNRSFAISIGYFTKDWESSPDGELDKINLFWAGSSQPKTITLTIPQSVLSNHPDYSRSKSPIFIQKLFVKVTESVTGHDPIITFYEFKVGATVTVN